MKPYITTILVLFSISSSYAQQGHIEQSTPFENVLLAMKTDSASLFMNAFSERIVGTNTDLDTWGGRANEGKEKFAERFGTYELNDFSYDFDEFESKLIIYFRSEEQFRMKVILEYDNWKLDEK